MIVTDWGVNVDAALADLLTLRLYLPEENIGSSAIRAAIRWWKRVTDTWAKAEFEVMHSRSAGAVLERVSLLADGN